MRKLSKCFIVNTAWVLILEHCKERTLRIEELYRRGFPTPLVDVITFIENEISSNGCSIGYRAMHQRCIRNGYKVGKENV